MRDWRYFVTDDTLSSGLVDEEFQGLKLPADVIDKIYYKNAQDWLNVFKDSDKGEPQYVSANRKDLAR